MAVSVEDPLAYEWLSLLIDAFEKSAIESGEREAFLVLAHGPLTGMETALDGSESVLTKVKTSRQLLLDENGNSEKPTPKSIIEKSNIDFDKDLTELFGAEDNPTANYIEECFGCDLRLSFDWQLKPLSLMGPIDAFLDTINAALDAFNQRLDPFDILKQICFLMNHLKLLCPADLIMILLALKMLLKKYLLQLFNIKFDWTVLLGPLLKFIVDSLASLLEQIAQLILAPIDCVLTGLKSANALFHSLNDFLGTAKGFGETVGSGIAKGVADPIGAFGKTTKNLDGDTTFRDSQWISEEDGKDKNGVPDLGRLKSRDSKGADGQQPGVSLFTGFELKNDMTLSSAMSDPAFPQATFLENLIIPVQEARNWIRELFDNLIQALRSLNGLVGGGLKLNLDFMGILLFIKDMIGLVMMIIRLLKSHGNIADWCSYLEQNPEVLQQALRVSFGQGVTVEAAGGDAGLLVRMGPDIVGKIETCSGARSENDAQIISQWVDDLKL